MSLEEIPPGLPDRLPVLPLRDTVTFPDTLTPLAVGQERSIQLVNDALVGNRMLVMLASTDPEVEAPEPPQLHRLGGAGGGGRVRTAGGGGGEPYLVADVHELPDEVDEGPELTALMRNVQQTFTRII